MNFLFSILCFMVAIFYSESPLYAQVKIAFIEIHDRNGKTVELEPHGQFAHVAISYHDLWLHAYPGRPVQLINTTQLLKLGSRVEFKTLSTLPPLEYDDISPFLGAEYDSNFDWNDNKMYCSELVSKILNIPPRPMNFNAPYWPKSFHKKNGLPGMSPDGLYQILKSLDAI